MKTEIKNKIGCFILSRTSSKRLPGKALMEIKGKPLIRHLINRAKLMRGVNVIVLCTSTGQDDDALADIAAEAGIKVFRGSLGDVLARFLGAALKFDVDYFAVFSGDNIFCDPGLAELGIKQMIQNNLDFINVPDDLVCGGASYCISTKALEKVCQLKNDDNIEYYPKYFLAGTSFNTEELQVDDPTYRTDNIRLTVDYPEDLDCIRKIFNEFEVDASLLPLKKIIKLLRQKPEIGRINFFRHADWSNNQKPMKQLHDDFSND